ncbi:putative oxido [Cyphellophora attinorum]|uniref:Putative oxido n=1 Tax=Cyphellophora attinorum TaxID=1664694 RepID=A0A0N1HWB8_9EURO|nr:putative oxido [Phialophora attinorum]KPI41874.1 putative oxido [Phialophora attinorum]
MYTKAFLALIATASAVPSPRQTTSQSLNVTESTWDGECFYPKPVDDFSLDFYLGRWYQVAGSSFGETAGCTCIYAEYSLNENGTVNVLNGCQAGEQDVTIRASPVQQIQPMEKPACSESNSLLRLHQPNNLPAFEDATADAEVDVIVISSIPETHFAFAKAALEAGKHVIVEKPFVPTSAEASQLVEVVKRTGKQLSVFQNRRWDSDYCTVAKVMKEGLLGDIAEFETHFDRHRPDPPADSWKLEDKPGNGALYDLGSHLIDQIYHSFGLPEKVTGFVGNQRRGVKGGAPDSCTVLLHYPGMLATAKAGVVSCETKQLRFWVKGTKGSFKKFHLDVQEGQLRDGMRPADKGYGLDPEEHYGTLTTLIDGKPQREVYPTVEAPTYVAYYRQFAEALAGKAPVPVSAEEARDVLRIIEAAIQSSHEERSVRI